MRVGNKVKIKATSIFLKENNRHNPIDTVGIVQEIGNQFQNEKRYIELQILVNWGGFTNSYKKADLEIIIQ